MAEMRARRARISMADAADRRRIYEMRHAVYAEELRQHSVNTSAMLSDSLDDSNEYVVAYIEGHLAGFISITTPGGERYSIDKYVRREGLELIFDDGLYELRVLTIAKEHRSSRLAATLMYAAFRWVEEHGGRHIVAMGRTEVVSIYLKHGLRRMGRQISCGALTFELLQTEMSQLRRLAEDRELYLKRLQAEVAWGLDFPFFKPVGCFHGGAFFEAIGPGFETLERRRDIVSADVLDAWFPASPKVLDTLREHLPWLLGTSPPTNCEGLQLAIARARGVNPENILPGAGSSDLIYMAFRQWLRKGSKVLILDPMYGEYQHVLENVIGCTVDRLELKRRSGYALDLDVLEERMKIGYDMVVLVNPNNPSGRHVPRRQLQRVLANVPRRTRVWVDEAYLEYVGPDQSQERFAAITENVIVCKTMSKVYALSGCRVGYLCAAPQQLAELIPLTPPWAVGLPAQVAAVRALEDGAYYASRYRETHDLREDLIAGLRKIGVREIVPGVANFVMFHLQPEHPPAVEVLATCRQRGVFFRDISRMGTKVGTRGVRIAVKDAATNACVLDTLAAALGVQEQIVLRDVVGEVTI